MTAVLQDPHKRRINSTAQTGMAYQAYRILQIGFVVAPIVAGLDKFFDKLADWDKYLAPQVASLLGGSHGFMMVAGSIEIVVGIGVALKPRYFAYIVSAWLLGIVINLLMTGQYFDIALRDFGLALAAFALARLAQLYDHNSLHDLITTLQPSR